MTNKKPPKDPNQLAMYIVDVTTGELKEDDTRYYVEKDPNAVALGRKGGLKGGKARAKSLTAEERSEIAKKAAKARWEEKEPVE